jgi:hypothetical protein
MFFNFILTSGFSSLPYLTSYTFNKEKKLNFLSYVIVHHVNINNHEEVSQGMKGSNIKIEYRVDKKLIQNTSI